MSERRNWEKQSLAFSATSEAAKPGREANRAEMQESSHSRRSWRPRFRRKSSTGRAGSEEWPAGGGEEGGGEMTSAASRKSSSEISRGEEGFAEGLELGLGFWGFREIRVPRV